MVIGGMEDSSDGEERVWLGTPQEAGFFLSLFLFFSRGTATQQRSLFFSLWLGSWLHQYGRITALIFVLSLRERQGPAHLYVHPILYDSERG